MMRRLFFAYRVHKNIRVCLVHKRTPITPNLPILCVPASTKNPFLVLKSQVMNKKICILTKAKLSNSLNFCHKIQWKMWILSSNKKLIYSIWVLEQKVDFWHSVHMVSYLKHFVGSSGHWLSFDLWKKEAKMLFWLLLQVWKWWWWWWLLKDFLKMFLLQWRTPEWASAAPAAP